MTKMDRNVHFPVMQGSYTLGISTDVQLHTPEEIVYGEIFMIGTTTRRWPPVVRVISALTIADAITFLSAALLHAGAFILLGFMEPQWIAAAIVEGLCGLVLLVGFYAIFTHKTWAWKGVVAAHLFAVAGVVLGIFSTSGSSITDDTANFIYHRVILVVLLVVLALLATRGARKGLSLGKQTM